MRTHSRPLLYPLSPPPAVHMQAMSIPVLANGNIRTLADAHACLEYTGCDGVMSAESLLEDPCLFDPERLLPGVSACRVERWKVMVRPMYVQWLRS